MISYILVPRQNITANACAAAIKQIECQGINLLSCEHFHADLPWELILKIETDLREQEAVYLAMLNLAGIYDVQLLHLV